MTALPAPFLRALGADPEVYRPVARAHARIIDRRIRFGRSGTRFRRGLTAFQLRCLATLVLSIYLMLWITGTRTPLTGAVLALTAGGGLILFDILFDKFDLLVDPDEYAVLAAHPHHVWSVMLAKIVTVGRSTLTLAACTFLLPSIGAGIAFHSVPAGLAFLVGAFALTVLVALAGILTGAAIVVARGRAALNGILPVAHIAFLFVYVSIPLGRQILAGHELPNLRSLGWVAWVLPSVWFAAPLEAVTGEANSITIVRGALAFASVAAMFPIGARWIGTRFGERLLEPTTRRARRAAQSSGESSARRSWLPWRRDPIDRVFHRFLLTHLRSDVGFRGSLIVPIMMPFMMSIATVPRSGHNSEGPRTVLFVITLANALAVTSCLWLLTRSSRPQAVWPVLIAPEARVRFSSALVTTIRTFVVGPVLVGVFVYYLVLGAGSLSTRLFLVGALAVLSDTVLVTTRGIAPDTPFSQSIKGRARFGLLQAGCWLFVMITGAVLIGVLIVFPKIGVVGYTCAILWLLLWRVLLGFWARERVRRAAIAVELGVDRT
jgi:hypothetical protein